MTQALKAQLNKDNHYEFERYLHHVVLHRRTVCMGLILRASALGNGGIQFPGCGAKSAPNPG